MLTSLIDAIVDLSARWLPAMADVAIKATLFLLICSITTLCLRRASGAAKHVLWFSGLTGALLLPGMAWLLPAWRILPPRLTPHGDVVHSLSIQTVETVNFQPKSKGRTHLRPSFTNSQLSAVSPTAAPEFEPKLTVYAYVFLTWFGGALIFFLPLPLAMLSLANLARRSTRISDPERLTLLRDLSKRLNVRRSVILLETDMRAMPMVWGIWSSRLLLPAASAKWPREKLRAVLIHELAHVKRWDCLTQFIARLVCALYWFNPFAWLARRRMQIEQENACDELVLGAGETASAYAEQLLQIASGFNTPRWTSSSSIAMARRSHVEGRLLAILNFTCASRKLSSRGVSALAIALIAICIPLAALHAGDGDSANPKASQTPRTPTILPDDQWKVILPNGMSVELIGISEHPSQPRGWWTPIGSALPTAPYDQLGVRLLDVKPNTLSREFALRYQDMPVRDVDTTVSMYGFYPASAASKEVESIRVGSGTPKKDGKPIRELYAVAAVIPNKASSVRLNVGIAYEPWKNVESYPAESAIISLPRKAAAHFEKPLEEHGHVVIAVTHNFKDRALRLIAIGNDSRLKKPGYVETDGDDKSNKIKATFEKTTLKDIQRFVLQSREYHWVKFEDVALRPGHHAAAAPEHQIIAAPDQSSVTVPSESTRDDAKPTIRTQKSWHPSPPPPSGFPSGVVVIPSPYAAKGSEPLVPWDLAQQIKVGQTKAQVIELFRKRGHIAPADEDAQGRYLLFATNNDKSWEVALRIDADRRVADISYKEINLYDFGAIDPPNDNRLQLAGTKAGKELLASLENDDAAGALSALQKILDLEPDIIARLRDDDAHEALIKLAFQQLKTIKHALEQGNLAEAKRIIVETYGADTMTRIIEALVGAKPTDIKVRESMRRVTNPGGHTQDTSQNIIRPGDQVLVRLKAKKPSTYNNSTIYTVNDHGSITLDSRLGSPTIEVAGLDESQSTDAVRKSLKHPESWEEVRVERGANVR